jgi:hypothetical protein
MSQDAGVGKLAIENREEDQFYKPSSCGLLIHRLHRFHRFASC